MVAAVDLCILTEAWQWLGIDPGTDEGAMQQAISGVSGAIASWCSRNFVPADYIEVYDGVGQRALTLRNFPILSVTSVMVDGQPISAANGPLSTGYLASGRTIALNGYRFNPGFQNVVISYRAGLVPVPPELKQACLMWIQDWYLGKERDLGLASERAGDHEEKYGSGGAFIGGQAVPMPAAVYAILGQYRDVVPV